MSIIGFLGFLAIIPWVFLTRGHVMIWTAPFTEMKLTWYCIFNIFEIAKFFNLLDRIEHDESYRNGVFKFDTDGVRIIKEINPILEQYVDNEIQIPKLVLNKADDFYRHFDQELKPCMKYIKPLSGLQLHLVSLAYLESQDKKNDIEFWVLQHV